jgi:ABC-type transport system involved in cytochrome c biogenesis permease subunit
VSDTVLAELSNDLVYATMFVLTLAMIGYAYDLAVAGRRGRVAADAEVGADVGAEAKVAVAVGSGVSSTSGAAGGAASTLGGSGIRTKASNIAYSLTWLSLVLLTGAVLARSFAAGRVPWGNMYEFALTTTWSVLALYLVLSRKYDLQWMGVLIVTPVLLALGLSITVLYTDAAELVPALRSTWLIIHVYIAKSSFEEKGSPSGGLGFLARIPSAKAIDTVAYRIHAFVFPLWTFAVIAGAIWAENAWGRYWGWDPKETWAFITWVIYAGYLHARATAGWKGKRVAVISLIGFASLNFNFFIVNIVLPGLHSYSGL